MPLLARASGSEAVRDDVAAEVAGVTDGADLAVLGQDQLALLAHKVEEAIRGGGQAEVNALEIGLAILPPLRELDEIAYLRFASVYQGFDSLEDFESAISRLREEDAVK